MYGGFVLGGMVSAILQQKIGFRNTYIFGAFLFVLSMLLCSYAPVVQVTYVMFIGGLGTTNMLFTG